MQIETLELNSMNIQNAFSSQKIFTEEEHMQIQSATEQPLYEVDGEVVCGT